MPCCELTGKGPVVKNIVSHSNIKNKSKAYPNIQQKRLFSTGLQEFVKLKVAVSTIKDLEHSGGFDGFLLRQQDTKLSKRALKVKNRLKKRLQAK